MWSTNMLESTSYPGTTEEQIVNKIKKIYCWKKYICLFFTREKLGNKKFKNKMFQK